MKTLDEVKQPVCNMRVRFVSEHPEREPEGTIIEVGFASVKIGWDDDHSPTIVERRRYHILEVV